MRIYRIIVETESEHLDFFMPQDIDKLFSLIIKSKLADEIILTKHYSITKEVISRLEGKE